MKKTILFLVLSVVLVFLIGRGIEPPSTTYGEIVHTSVRKFYENYEILNLCHIEKDGKPTLDNLCVVDDTQEGIDVLCISFLHSKDNHGEYISTETITADNIKIGKTYSTEDNFENIIVEYIICEKKDIPPSTLQKEKFKFNGQNMYLCITNFTEKI